MILEEDINKIKRVCGKYKEIALLYVFGSVAREEAGPLSDYDFAVYLDEKNKERRFAIKIELMGKLGSILKTDKVDVVVINDTESPFLKYAVVRDGILVCEQKPFKVAMETAIMSEYFDLRESFLRYNFAK